MRICMLIDSWFPIYGGGNIHVFEVSKIMVKNFSCQVDIYTRALRDEQGKKFRANEVLLNGKLRIFRIGPAADYFFLPARLFWLLNVSLAILRNNFRQKYELIHAHAFLSSLPAKIIKFFTGIPIIYSVHGTSIGLNKKSGAEKIEKWLVAGIRYDQETSVARNFLKFENVNKNITIVPNGINIENFDKIENKKSGRFKMIYVGRFDKIKGLDNLIKAAALLNKKNGDFIIHLIGYGYEEKKLKKLVQNLHLEDKIIFRGKLTGEKLIMEYKSADLFVLPSKSEGQPLTLLEAWAAKLPVIVTRVGDNGLLVNKENGYLIEPDNISALAEAISRALKNKNLSSLGTNGYNLVKNKFTWEQTAKKYYDLYLKYENFKHN